MTIRVADKWNKNERGESTQNNNFLSRNALDTISINQSFIRCCFTFPLEVTFSAALDIAYTDTHANYNN